jgi:hypothetical protein
VLCWAARRVWRKNSWFVGNAFAFPQQREYNERGDYDSLQNDRDNQSAPAYFAFAPLLLWVTFNKAAFQ